MAIAHISTLSIDATAGNGNTSVTIPANATVAVALLAFWDAGASNLASVTIDGQSAIVRQQIDVNSFASSVNALTATGFSTGASKTIAWTYDSDQAISEGGRLYIAFTSGASATPVNSGGDAQESGTSPSFTMENTATTNVGFVLGETFNAATVIDTPSGASVTSIYDNENNNSHQVDVVFYTYSTTGVKTYEITSSPDYSALVGVILAEAAAGGANPKGPLGMPFHGPFAGPIG